MVSTLVTCPTCHTENIVKYGQTSEGKQRFYCQNALCTRQTFLQEYTYQGKYPHVKDQIIDMAMNGSGIRDTARVLHVSPTTVIEILKKKNRSCSQ